MKTMKMIPIVVKQSRFSNLLVSNVAKRKLHISVKPIETSSVCKFDNNMFVSFGRFYTILNQLHKLSTTRAYIHMTIAYAFIFHRFISVSITSQAAQYLSRVGTAYTLPLFLTVLIMKVGLEIRTTTLNEGGIKGFTHCKASISDVTMGLLTLSYDEYCKTISSSPFFTFSDKSDYDLVISKIRSTLPGFTGSFDTEEGITLHNEEKLFHQMFGFYASVPSIFHIPERGFGMVDFKLERVVSKFINIHRFRNGSDYSHYVVNAHSISSLHDTSQAEFACFLRLFVPIFYQDMECKSSLDIILPNDVIFEISTITEEQALEYLFKITRSGGNGTTKTSTVDAHRSISNDKQVEPEVSEDVVLKRKKYREKFLKGRDSKGNKDTKILADPLVKAIQYAVMTTLHDYLINSNDYSVSTLDTGYELIHYYSPNKIHIPKFKISTNDILFSY